MSATKNAITMLVEAARTYRHKEDYVAALQQQLEESTCNQEDVSRIVSGLRSAAAVHFGTGERDAGLRCSFCGKGSNDVALLLTSSTATICDECVSAGYLTVRRKTRQYWIRHPWQWIKNATGSRTR